MSREIPILFSTLMVQALLAGRKTQTRRIIDAGFDCNKYDFIHLIQHDRDVLGHQAYFKDEYGNHLGTRCRFGAPGDILWVRENYKLVGWDFEDGIGLAEYADGTREQLYYVPDGGGIDLPQAEKDAIYKAQEKAEKWMEDKVAKLIERGYFAPEEDPEDGSDPCIIHTDKPQPFEPAIHMPKWAARIWLQVQEVNVERLHDITESESKAEGVEHALHNASGLKGLADFKNRHYKVGFAKLWSELNGRQSWDANPWVWVVKFKVLSTTGKPGM